jgi:predicted small lipoprotein YifL
MKASRLIPLSLALAGVALAGCGSLGDLERPEDPAKRAAFEAERRAMAGRGNQTSAPRSDEELADPATSRGNTRESPIGGGPSDPFAGPGSDPR